MTTEHFQRFAGMRGESVQHECDMLGLDVPLAFALSCYGARGRNGPQTMNDDPRKVYREDWRAHNEFSVGTIGVLERKAAALLAFNVEYGRSALRTLLELNGGGLIALPSFAALFGSIWTRGDVWPFLAGGVFVGGLTFAAVGYGFAFYCFSEMQAEIAATMTRVGDSLEQSWNAFLTQQPIPPPNKTPTSAEVAHKEKAGWLN